MSHPRPRNFTQVDVFTDRAMLGNPVAVVLDAAGLDDATMQAFAAWTNLSETTFVLPPSTTDAHYRVRIFTPKSELPFAGHPTLGTAHAVIAAGLATPREGRLVQECAVGLVELSVGHGGALSFRLPRYAGAEVGDHAAATDWIGAGVALNGEPWLMDVGPVWLIAELAEVAALEELAPDLNALADYQRATGATGATLYAAADDGGVTVRSFAPADGIAEDPVCGSGNGAVAAYRLGVGQIGDGDAYIASQGRQVGRDGRISLRIDGTDVHVGGQCVTVIEGVARI